MATNYAIDNENIAAGPFLSFNMVSATGFNQADLLANTTAASLVDDNTVGKGDAGSRILGKVVWVSPDLIPNTTIPVVCALQARGVAKFIYTGVVPPAIGETVEAGGNGKVQRSTATNEVAAGGLPHNGIVLSVDTNSYTCEVWLG